MPDRASRSSDGRVVPVAGEEAQVGDREAVAHERERARAQRTVGSGAGGSSSAIAAGAPARSSARAQDRSGVDDERPEGRPMSRPSPPTKPPTLGRVAVPAVELACDVAPAFVGHPAARVERIERVADPPFDVVRCRERRVAGQARADRGGRACRARSSPRGRSRPRPGRRGRPAVGRRRRRPCRAGG